MTEERGDVALPEKKEIFTRASHLLEEGKSAVVYTVLASGGLAGVKAGSRVLVAGPDEVIGTTGDLHLDRYLMVRGISRLEEGDFKPGMLELFYCLSDKRVEEAASGGEGLSQDAAQISILEDMLLPKEKLFILGAGHIAGYLAPLASLIGFQVTVVDDREEYANQERFPHADRVICAPFPEILPQIAAEIDRNTSVVIVTRGHNYDEMCLQHLSPAPARYIGMIGSLRKIEQNFRSLENKGISREILNKVRAPIGLDLGSQDPAHIALGILAEMIACAHEGSCRPMKEIRGMK